MLQQCVIDCLGEKGTESSRNVGRHLAAHGLLQPLKARYSGLFHFLQQRPDVLACTGDLTAMSTDSEWGAAKRLLGPMFEGQPSVLIPGNHDVYVAADETRRSFAL